MMRVWDRENQVALYHIRMFSALVRPVKPELAETLYKFV
jgi:hypothetical protein